MVSLPAAETETAEQRFVMGGISWDAYVTICDALDEHIGVRMIYNDGRLIFVGKSRNHDWLSDCLGHLVWRSRSYLESPASRRAKRPIAAASKRRASKAISTFHLGVNAERMRGPQELRF